MTKSYIHQGANPIESVTIYACLEPDIPFIFVLDVRDTIHRISGLRIFLHVGP